MNIKTSNDKYRKILAAIIAVAILIIGFKIYFSVAPPPKKMSFEQRIQQMIDDETGKTAIIEGQKKELAHRLKENNSKNKGAYIIKTLIATVFISIIPVLIFLGLTRKTERTDKAENKKLKESVSNFESLKSKKECVEDEEEIVFNKTEDIDYSIKNDIPILKMDKEKEETTKDTSVEEELTKDTSVEEETETESNTKDDDIKMNKAENVTEEESMEKEISEKKEEISIEDENITEEDKNTNKEENTVKKESELSIPDIPDL